MKKQILTGLGVLLFGSSMAFAAPQTVRTNFNDQPAYQTQQQQQHHKISRAKQRKHRDGRDNCRG